MMGRGFGGFGGYGMMGGSSFMMILVIAAVGFLIYLALNKNKQTSNQKDANLSPQNNVESEALNMAKTRLAKGEITVEEFEQIKKNLL